MAMATEMIHTMSIRKIQDTGGRESIVSDFSDMESVDSRQQLFLATSSRPTIDDMHQSLLFQNNEDDSPDASYFKRKLTIMVNKERKKIKSTGGSSKPDADTETIKKMTSTVRRIFLKIRDHLDNPAHPLIQIIRSFQTAFVRDTRAQFFQLNPSMVRKMIVRNHAIKLDGQEVDVEDVDYAWARIDEIVRSTPSSVASSKLEINGTIHNKQPALLKN